MVSRAEKLLEGFKLGALGAGRKPIYYEVPELPKQPEKPSKIKIIKEIERDYLSVSSGDVQKFPSIEWEEPDGYRYELSLGTLQKFGDAYIFVLVCIPPTKASTMWQAYSKKRTREYDKRLAEFVSIVSGVKVRGIRAVPIKDFAAPSPFTNRFIEWRESRKRKNKI